MYFSEDAERAALVLFLSFIRLESLPLLLHSLLWYTCDKVRLVSTYAARPHNELVTEYATEVYWYSDVADDEALVVKSFDKYLGIFGKNQDDEECQCYK